MKPLLFYRWGLGIDVVLALLALAVFSFGELAFALLVTAGIHALIASLVYWRGRRRSFTKMDQVFLAGGQSAIALFILFLGLLLANYYYSRGMR